jgi:hypothetical protein
MALTKKSYLFYFSISLLTLTLALSRRKDCLTGWIPWAGEGIF